MFRAGARSRDAAVESFLSLLQKNVLDRRSVVDSGTLAGGDRDRIERTYDRKHRRRPKDSSTSEGGSQHRLACRSHEAVTFCH